MADFGSDVSCVSDIDPTGRVVSGSLVVGEAVARRWGTPRGRLINDPNYGFDLRQFINADMSPRDIAELQAGAESEAEKDERVSGATVTATLEADGTLTIVAQLVTSEGPFTLTVSVSDVTLALISVNP